MNDLCSSQTYCSYIDGILNFCPLHIRHKELTFAQVFALLPLHCKFTFQFGNINNFSIRDFFFFWFATHSHLIRKLLSRSNTTKDKQTSESLWLISKLYKFTNSVVCLLLFSFLLANWQPDDVWYMNARFIRSCVCECVEQCAITNLRSVCQHKQISLSRCDFVCVCLLVGRNDRSVKTAA